MLRPALLLAAWAALPGAAHAWPDAVHEQVVRLSILLMPPALAEQLNRHEAALIAGAIAADHDSDPAQHALHTDGSGGDLDIRVAEEVGRAVLTMRDRVRFEEFATGLGRISHYVADAAFPLNTSASDPNEPSYYADYGEYAARKLGKFRPVFNGYLDMSDGFDVAQHMRSVSAQANRGYSFVSRGYYPAGATTMRSSATFDDRGPVFGITQLAFVNAVSATANVWLYTWRMAHGDVQGTPFTPSAKEATHDVHGTARTAQRP